MRFRSTGCALLCLICSVSASGQINIYGQASTAFVGSSDEETQLIVNAGRPTFLWRADLLADALIVPGVTAMLNLRILQDQRINIDYLAVRIDNLTALKLTIQAGKFDMPFGNLYNRRFPRENFLYGIPLMYEFQTAVMSSYLYPGPEAFLNQRGRGGLTYTPSSMPLLERGIYGTGAMVAGSAGIFDVFLAVMNGTVSNTGAYTNDLNINKEFGKLVRVTATPVTGFTIGTSFMWGSYLHDMVRNSLPGGKRPEDYKQYTGGLDLEFSRGHLQFFAHGIYNRWEYPLFSEPLDMIGYYAEAKYTVLPRLFIAGRMNQLIPSKIRHGGASIPWEFNVMQAEGGIGFAIERHTLVKLVYRHTAIDASPVIENSLVAVQLIAAF